ncbi:uracil-DNA glycosylase [Favolaschia claudopus]|uniref:Uracil-DNA glycosylase n=1 Tax=Favolaschia claudopus TaxID=2862362 RepID=A0AAW0C9J6_9AGAR
MPKDAKPTKLVRPTRTMSKVTAAFAKVTTEQVTVTEIVGDSITNADDKLEGSSKSVTPLLQPGEITLEFLERDTMGASWLIALRDEFQKPYFAKLKKFVGDERQKHTVYPSIDNIYSWSRLTPLDNVRVVVLGQDPYHDVGQAHGLSFSVLPPTKPPGSLKNIYKQLKADYPDFVPPTTGDLSPLAAAGVLFLNTSLTVRAHSAASHAKKGWEELTGAALRCVAARPAARGVVFMAWGLPAQKVITRIGVDETKHLVLRSAHPSPLSAHRGFLGNGHFWAANDWLEERYGKEGCIDWGVLSASRLKKEKTIDKLLTIGLLNLEIAAYIPLLVFPALTALAFNFTLGHMMASGLAEDLDPHCPPTVGSTAYRLKYSGVDAIDSTLCGLVSFFHLSLDSHIVRSYLVYFFNTSLPLVAVPALEAMRSGRPSALALPFLLGLGGQLFTIGATIPLYWCLFIVTGAAGAAPKASKPTQITAAHAQAAIFGIFIGGLVTTVCLLWLEDPYVTALWQIFPVLQLVAEKAHLFVRPARNSGAASGFRWIQALYILAFVAASSTHVSALATMSSWQDFFLPSLAPRIGAASELKALDMLQWDITFAFASTMLATLWFGRNARQVVTILLWNIIGSILVGPGAAITAVALWRESYLHSDIPKEQGKAE